MHIPTPADRPCHALHAMLDNLSRMHSLLTAAPQVGVTGRKGTPAPSALTA